MERKKVIEFRNIAKSFDKQITLKGINLDIYENEFVTLLGPSGCGKTTMGRTILKLHNSNGGQIIFDGQDITPLKSSQMREIRKQMQIIFQDPYSSLNPRFTIGQIIEEGLVTHKFFKHGSEKMREHIVDTMEKCGLQEYMLHRYPHQFSGGQRQRVAIARALAVNPKFIVCDEPVSALDVSIQAQIINLLKKLQKERNLTYLFISHDLSVVNIYDQRERELPAVGLLTMRDAETGQTVWVDTTDASVRKAYELWNREAFAATSALLRKYKVDSVSIATDQDYVKGLVTLFKSR